MNNDLNVRNDVIRKLGGLSSSQLLFVNRMIDKLNTNYIQLINNPNSDFATDTFVRLLGDYLKVHHCLSKEPLSKDKFEYALEAVCNQIGFAAQLAVRGNPGHDITICNQSFSLKTQADKDIRQDKLWISKFMELGRGDWTNQPQQLVALREQFFSHLSSYDRILQFRCLSRNTRHYSENQYHYELIEIPKQLLFESANANLVFSERSNAAPHEARPAVGQVVDYDNNLRFQLYFDGKGERKLHIQHLQTNLCIKHAEWRFDLTE